MQNSEIIIYQSNGNVKIDVRLEDETVWLTQQAQMAQLFGKGRTTITEHIQNIFEEGELQEEVVYRKFRHATQHGAIDGKTQTVEVNSYNLDAIISVGSMKNRRCSVRNMRLSLFSTELKRLS